MGFDRKSYNRNTYREFMMIKARYNVNEDLDMCQSLLHKVIFTQMNAKKGIYIFG